MFSRGKDWEGTTVESIPRVGLHAPHPTDASLATMVLRFPRRRFKWRWGAVVAATTAAVLVGAAASSFPTRPKLAMRPLQAAARQAGWMIMEGDSNAGHESSYDNLGVSSSVGSVRAQKAAALPVLLLPCLQKRRDAA